MTVRVEGGAGWLAVSAGVAFNSNRENVNGEVEVEGDGEDGLFLSCV